MRVRRWIPSLWITTLALTMSVSIALIADEVTIVVPKDPAPALAEAAEDLEVYLGKAAGVEATVTDAKAKRILIGADAPGVTEADLPPQSAGIEASRIRRRDGAIVIAGRDPVATANGVYTFIQKYLGVRWFTPGELGEYVPKEQPANVFDKVSDEVVAPVFSPRIWAIRGSRFSPEAWKRWMRRNRIDSPRGTPGITADAMVGWLNRFWRTPGVKERDESYPLVGGKRRVVKPFGKLPPGMNRRWYWAPCWSSDEAVEIVVKGCQDYFDENPGISTVSLALDDVDIYCQCDACQALDAGVPVNFKSGDAGISNRWYWLVDKVARRLHESHPGKYVRTLIYKNARAAPTTLDRLPDNVIGILAASTAPAAEWRVPDIREKEIAESTAWSKVCKTLGRWEYLAGNELTPRYFPHLLDEVTKFDAAHGITAAGPCGTRCILPHVAPMYWAVLQQYWQPDLDIDKLLDEFFTDYFAESAEPMKAYFDSMETLWNNPDRGMFSGWGGVRSNAQFLSEADMEKAETLLAQAAAAAKTKETAEKVAEVARAFEYGALMTRTHLLATQLERLPVTNVETAKAALAEVVKASAFCAGRDRRWDALMKGDDLAGQGLRIQRDCPGNVILHRLSVLDQPIDDVFVRAVAYLAKNAPKELGPALAAAAKGNGQTRLGVAAQELAAAKEPAKRALDSAFWRKALGYDVDLDEQVTDRLNIGDFSDRAGLTMLFDWAKPGDTTITLKDYPAFDTKDDQASFMMKPPAVDGSAYQAVLAIPHKTPMIWQWPAVTLTDLAVTDWRPYAGFAIGFHNPSSESEEVGVSIRDKTKTCWHTRFPLAPGQTKIISVPMDDIAKKLDTGAILAFTIYTQRPTQQQVFDVTPVFLVDKSRRRTFDLLAKVTEGNGGFEKGNLDGWKPEARGNGTVQVVTDDVAEGKCAARVRAGEKDLAVLSAVVEQKHGLDKQRTYRLSFAAKPLAGRTRVVVAGGPHCNVSEWLHTTPEWKQYTFTLGFVHPDGEGPGKGTDIPLSFRHLSIQFYGAKPFDLLLDDVKLEAE